ncbi:HlyD family efflux transporter periplasmic adaptor subunit [Coprococcus ammoniilyticus]|jgi:multidrug resistance efflux pump|uniref:HlyD family efflux transporter periplasmic adaptor subunit n=1 Tax=Coprococcus ammoniilyticus TaxID=2981785 RepID=A0ABV1EJ72_9FIRM
MKPIIVDMKDISDSTEVYESKPNRFLIYTIYLILIILVVAVLWMRLFKIDVVVKSNGIFKGSNAVYEISSDVTGSVKETNIQDGQYVKEGDILYVLTIDELSDTILRYQNELEAAQARIKILSAYEKSLDGDKTELETLDDNPYYEEFVNRRKLLYANVDLNESDTEGQVTLYQGNVDSISGTIAKYNEKIEKLNVVKQCITARNNTFDASEGIYYSMISSYLASYNYTALQYDNQINEHQRQIDEYEEQMKKAEAEASIEDKTVTEEETVSDNGISTETISVVASTENTTANIEELKKQRDALITAQDSAKKEKTRALRNLELQQITTIEQQIAGYNDTILSLETNLASAKLQLEAINSADNETKESVAILTEKGNVAAEILNYEDKVKECETYLKSYDIQNDNCVIKANVSGYFYIAQDLKTGSFVQEGTTIGTIYPETESKYYAEIYVENTDIAQIREGQDVKFEIAAYPSSEYGYFKGTVENIAKNISVDQSTGYSYYLVRVKCDNMTLKGKNGEEATLMNGMACQAKIVIDEKNVLTYFGEKIDLLD